MTDLDTQLRSLADHRLTKVPEFTEPTTETIEEVPRPSRGRRPAFLAAAAALLIAIVAAGVVLLDGDDPDLLVQPGFESVAFGERDVVERDDWSTTTDIATPSTFVVAELGVDDPIQAAVLGRARQQFLPASTFKLLNALILLDAGVVEGLDTVVRWDGVERGIEAWNSDLTLAEAIQVSAVWVFETLSNQVDAQQKAGAVAAADYGNGNAGDAEGAYWLEGDLAISALEQVAFLDALSRGELAYPAATQAAVLDTLPTVEVEGTTIRYKTGTALRGPDPVAWIVGIASNERGTWAFAHNADLTMVAGEAQQISTEVRLETVIALLTDAGAIG